jgi:transporter family protein
LAVRAPAVSRLTLGRLRLPDSLNLLRCVASASFPLPPVVGEVMNNWVALTLLSALALGIYEVAKKTSVRDNPVAPVLYLNASVCAAFWLPFVVWSWYSPTTVPSSWLTVKSLTGVEHLALFAKSLIVGSSWSLAYFAVKQLPISISSPIRATSPFWTILFATLVLSEHPEPLQWLGMGIVLVSFYAFSLVGRLEGIHFHRDKWVGLMLLATLLAAISSLYDKFLLQNLALDAPTVQAWFSLYLLIVLLPILLYWRFVDSPRLAFRWRWSIAMIAFSLLIADFLYFSAITKSGALISVISTLRRTSIVISFLIGIFLMGEKNFRQKAICIALMLFGVALVSLGRR